MARHSLTVANQSHIVERRQFVHGHLDNSCRLNSPRPRTADQAQNLTSCDNLPTPKFYRTNP